MKLIRSRILLTQAGPPIENGAVVIKGSKIVAVGRYRDLTGISTDERIDLGESILLPGLINAHCHLDYTGMRYKIPPGKSFCEWLQRIIALKATQTHKQYAAAIGEGWNELRRWGTTSVFNIQAVSDIMATLPVPPLRIWWFQETMDIRSPVCMETFAKDLPNFSKKHSGWLGGIGLSPHAPYTASDSLYRAVKFYAEKYALPVTTHLAETHEELKMFQEGCGPLFDFLKDRGCSVKNQKSSLTTLLEQGLLPLGTILVHMNVLTETDWKTLQKFAQNYTVVHCPKAHAYFNREKFHFERLRELGVNICLGTDSLASNDSLNLFEEMQLFQRLHRTTEQEAFNMVTLYPAKAIGLAGYLGVIASGAHADLIAFPYSGGLNEALSSIVYRRQPVDWTMIGGVVHK
jgi:cytosine/adenosine deaminase-related metal-dependent hydrolase